MTSRNPDREREVWRDFRQAQGDAMARRARENPPPDMGLPLLSFLSVLLICLTDPVVWWGLAPDFFFPVPSFRLFLASLVFLPLNGWLAHTLLVRWTPRDQERSRWLRATRLAAASLFPFGGLAILPFWRELLCRNPSWIRPRNGHPAPLTIRGLADEMPQRSALEDVHRSENLRFSLTIGSGLPFFVGGLMAAGPHGPFGKAGGVALNLAFHAVTFLGISHMIRRYSYLPTKSFRARLLLVNRWSLLLPSPVCSVGLAMIALAVFGPLRGTWIGGMYSHRSDALRFPLWKQAGQAFHPTLQGFSWADLTGRPPAAEPRRAGRSADRREALARLTLLFLAPEAGLLTWYVLSTGSWQPKESSLIAALIAAGCLTLAGLLLQALPGTAEKLRWDRVSVLSPYLRSGALFLPAAACLLGILGGMGAAREDLRLVGMIAGLFAGALALFGAAYALRGFVTKRFDLGFFTIWGLLYSALATLALLLEGRPDLAHRAVALVLLVPVLHLVAGLAFVPALLRPFTWKDMTDPRRSRGLRAVLAAFTLTAILPLGGLAAPFWIWARQKLWSRYLTEIQDR